MTWILVRSWWPRVIWQAVTLWLVNRGIVVCRGRSVEQVYYRKKTTWYENYVVSLGMSVQSESSRTRDTQPIRGVRLPLTIRLSRRRKRCYPLAPGRRFGTRWIPLSEYMILHLSLKLTTNCVPLSRIKRDMYFYKEVCFVCSWSSFIIFDYVLGWVYEKYRTLEAALHKSVTVWQLTFHLTNPPNKMKKPCWTLLKK